MGAHWLSRLSFFAFLVLPLPPPAAGGRPLTNAFRVSHTTPAIRSTTRLKRRPKAHPKRPPSAAGGGGGADADDEGDEVWDADAPDESSQVEGAAAARKRAAARPSSAFRGVSPRAPPPEAFEPDWVGLGQVMTVTSRTGMGLPGTRASRSASRASSKGTSKATSVAGSAAPSSRSTKSAVRPAPVAHDPDDPFAEDELAAGDANAAAAGDTPRSHRSHHSIASRASTVRSQATAATAIAAAAPPAVHDPTWFMAHLGLTGDMERDMALLQEKALALHAKVDEVRKLAASPDESSEAHDPDADAEQQDDEHPSPVDDYANENEEQEHDNENDEEEIFAQDGESASYENEDQDGAGLPQDDEHQQEEDERAAQEADAAQAYDDEDEDVGSADDHTHEPSHPDGASSSDFQADDLDDSAAEDHRRIAASSDPDASDADHYAPAHGAPAEQEEPRVDPSRKVLRPSNRHNVWAAREAVHDLPQLYTSAQWGDQTRADMARLANSTSSSQRPGQMNGNETSDIDTEVETEAEHDDPVEDAPHEDAHDDHENDDHDHEDDHNADLNATALFVVHADLASTKASNTGVSFSTTRGPAATGAFATNIVSDSEDDGGPPVHALLDASRTAKSAYTDIMKARRERAALATAASAAAAESHSDGELPVAEPASHPNSPPRRVATDSRSWQMLQAAEQASQSDASDPFASPHQTKTMSRTSPPRVRLEPTAAAAARTPPRNEHDDDDDDDDPFASNSSTPSRIPAPAPAHLDSSFDSSRPISPAAHEADADDHEHVLDSSIDFHASDPHAATPPPNNDDDPFAEM